jgi:hypothetical protein
MFIHIHNVLLMKLKKYNWWWFVSYMYQIYNNEKTQSAILLYLKK